MIKGLRRATIWSEGRGNLLPFYRDVLGLGVGVQTPGFVVLGEPGAPALALGTHSEVHGHNGDPARHMVALTSDDVRTDWKRLKAARRTCFTCRRRAAGRMSPCIQTSSIGFSKRCRRPAGR